MVKEYSGETCSLMSKIFTLYHNGEPVYSQRLYEDDIPSYIKKLEEDGYIEIGVMKKETFQKCKDTLKEAGIIDTNSKEYIEIQAYNKFADLMLELYEGDIIDEMNCPVCIIRQNIKDIRDELIEELTERKED